MGKKKDTYEDWYSGVFSLGGLTAFITTAEPQHGPPKPKLKDVVAWQVAELTADFEGKGGKEMPDTADYSTYADAYADAIRRCQHDDTVNTMYGRQWHCQSCGKFLDRAAMQAIKGDSYWWAW